MVARSQVRRACASATGPTSLPVAAPTTARSFFASASSTLSFASISPAWAL